MKKQMCFRLRPAIAGGILSAILIGITIHFEGVKLPQLFIALLLALCITAVGFMPDFSEIIASLIFCLSPFASFYLMESFTHHPWEMELLPQLVNLIVFYLIYLSLFAVTGNSRRTVTIANLFFLITGVANYYTSSFRGEPILPWDLKSIGTAVTITDNYTFSVDYPMLYILLGFLALFILGFKTSLRLKKKSLRVIFATGGIALLLTANSMLHIETVTDSLLTSSNLFTQWATYRDNGFLVSFMVNLKYLNIDTPAGYSPDAVKETMEDVIEEIAEKESNQLPTVTAPSLQKPKNIIVIMNEAFSDLSVLHEFASSEDPMPFIHSLQGSDNTIYGNLYMSVVGGNTANSEFEFLTNATMAFLPAGSVPYQQYVKEPLQSLASQLSGQGYSTIALHPYYASGWNRDQVYEYLGFDEALFKNDFTDPEIIRKYISDRSLYEKMISLYENKEAGESLFLFAVTMQNHGGYSQSFEDFTHDVTLTDITGYPGTEQYLSLIRESDRAFEELVNYFANQEEETIILMFGDHQPSGYVTNIIQNLDGKTEEERSLNEQQLRYITPFVMWANYDIDEKHYPALSANYLNTVLLTAAGLPLTGFEQFLSGLMDGLPVITANGFMDKNGLFHSLEDADGYEEYLNQYSAFQYNLLFDKEHQQEGFFE